MSAGSLIVNGRWLSDTRWNAADQPWPEPEASCEDARAMAARVPLVRSIVAPWEQGDFSAFRWADPEIEYVLVDGPSSGTLGGTRGYVGGVLRGAQRLP